MSLCDMRIPNMRKMAVLRANHLGDFILTLPALAALRAAYPTAEIVLLGARWHAQFLAERPSPIDRVVVVPPVNGVSATAAREEDPAALSAFFARMRAERFDLVVQMHGGGRFSNPFVSQLGAAVTAGLKTPDAPPLDRWLPYVRDQHELMRYLEVAALLGAPATTLEPRIQVTTADRAEAESLVPDDGCPLVVIHPGASDPARSWPVAKFAAVGEALAASTDARIAAVGDANERELAAQVVALMRGKARNLAGRMSLGGLAALLARARIVVANDSGPRHLAEAVGAATVGFYWCLNLITFGPLLRARHRVLVSWNVHCPVCGQDRSAGDCEHRDSVIADIPTDAAISEALALYEQEATAQPQRAVV